MRITFSTSRRLLLPLYGALAASGAFWTLPGAAQVVAEQPPVEAATRRYRDGALWVEVERAAEDTAHPGLRALRLRRGSRRFRASVGPHALVMLAPGIAQEALFARAGVTDDTLLSPRLRIHRVHGRRGEDGVDIASRLAGTPGIAAAVPDLYLARRPAEIAIPPNDPRYGAQWYLEHLAIEEAWRHATGSSDTAVVVIDGGCDMDHPDLVARFRGGLDLVDGDDDPTPAANRQGNAHGTACAGIIGAAGDNGVGIAGVCPECSLHCVRLYSQDDDYLVPVSADIMAFEYAFEVRAAVVSNSWGFADPTPVPEPLRVAIEDLIDTGRAGRGTLVVFAAGNEDRELGDDELVAVDGVLNVGAINHFDESAPYSNRGASLDLMAPAGTFTTDIAGPDGDDPGDYTNLFGGTSAACPVVAGVGALLLGARPTLTAREAAALLIGTARRAPFAASGTEHDPIYGYGIVDPPAALREALGISAPADAGSAPDAAGAADAGGAEADAARGRGPRNDAGGCASVGPGAQYPLAGVLLLLACVVSLARGTRALRRRGALDRP